MLTRVRSYAVVGSSSQAFVASELGMRIAAIGSKSAWQPWCRQCALKIQDTRRLIFGRTMVWREKELVEMGAIGEEK